MPRVDIHGHSERVTERSGLKELDKPTEWAVRVRLLAVIVFYLRQDAAHAYELLRRSRARD